MQEIDSIINIEEEIDKQISDKYLPNYNNITNNITNNMNNELIDDNDKEEVELTVKDVFESHSEYIVDQIKVRIQKHNDILFYSIGTANATNGKLIPSTIWTDIGILKEEYRLKTIINAYGTTGDSSSCSWIRIMPDGTMSVYQNSNRAQQCTACFCYPISDKTQVMELTVRDVFESYNKYVKDSKKVIIQKYDDILFYTFNTGNGTTTGESVPSGVWTDIGVLKKEYRPKTTIEAHGNNGGVNCNAMTKIMPDGSFEDITVTPMVRNIKEDNLYTGEIELKTGGDYGYTFRAMPKHPMLLDSASLNLIKWLEEEEKEEVSEGEKEEVENIIEELNNVV